MSIVGLRYTHWTLIGKLLNPLEVVHGVAIHPHTVTDTLVLAKTRFPGMPNSLDALCRRFTIDLSQRTTHNALLDCKLLAEVYVELTGGRQRGLGLAAELSASRPSIGTPASQPTRCPPSSNEASGLPNSKSLRDMGRLLWVMRRRVEKLRWTRSPPLWRSLRAP